MNELKRIEFDSQDPATDLTKLTMRAKTFAEPTAKVCNARIVEFARKFGFTANVEKKCWVSPVRDTEDTNTPDMAGATA